MLLPNSTSGSTLLILFVDINTNHILVEEVWYMKRRSIYVCVVRQVPHFEGLASQVSDLVAAEKFGRVIR
jgi:hypothetical protein